MHHKEAEHEATVIFIFALSLNAPLILLPFNAGAYFFS